MILRGDLLDNPLEWFQKASHLFALFPSFGNMYIFPIYKYFLSPQSKLCLEVMEKFLLLPYPQDQPSLNWQVTPTCL